MIAFVLLLTAGAGYLATQLGFDDTVQVLRSNRASSYEVQREIAEPLGLDGLRIGLPIEERHRAAELMMSPKAVDRLERVAA